MITFNKLCEKILNETAYVSNTVNYICFGFVKRIVTVPIYLTQILTPDFIKPVLGVSFNTVPLNDTTIEKGYFKPEKLVLLSDSTNPSQEKLKKLINRVEAIAKELGIQKTVSIYSKEDGGRNACMGCSLSQTPIPIFINRSTINGSTEVLDFTLAHELSHAANNDILKQSLFSFSILALDIVTAHYISPFAIPVIEGIGALLSNYIDQQFEREADRSALKILNTNEGAIQQFSKYHKEALQRRKEAEKTFSEDPITFIAEKTYFSTHFKRFFYLFFKETVTCVISPEGNFRADLSHPPVTERIAFARKFQKKL